MTKLYRSLGFAACFALLVTSQHSAGTQTATADSPAPRFWQLERDVPSLYLLNGLNLSPEQACKTASLCDQVMKIEEKSNEKLDRLMKIHQQEIEREANDILLSAGRKGGQIDLLKRQASPQAKKLHESLEEINSVRWEAQKKINALAQEQYDMLTDSQKKIMGNFVPCFIPANDFKNPERVGQAAADTSFVEKELKDLRNTPEDKRKEAQEKALFRITRHVMHKKYIPYSEENEAKVRKEISEKLSNALNRMASMKEADFELEKKPLASGIFILKTDSSPDALCWKISRYILNPGVADILKKRAAASEKKTASTAKTGDSGKKNAAYTTPESIDPSTPIKMATLIRGLELTSDQAGKLLPIIRDGVTARQKVESEMKQTMAEALDKYDYLRGELSEGAPKSESENKARKYHSKVKDLRHEKLVSELIAFESKLDQLLTADQVEFLSCEKKACDKPREKSLILRNDTDNESIDKGSARAKKLLSQARKMTSQELQKEGPAICRKFITDAIDDNKLKQDDINLDSEISRAMELLEKVRKMDSTKYSAQRNDLAADLCPKRSKPRDATYGNVDYKGDPEQVLNSSTQMLFTDPACTAIEKIASRKNK